jgi:hypothetical protein
MLMQKEILDLQQNLNGSTKIIQNMLQHLQ